MAVQTISSSLFTYSENFFDKRSKTKILVDKISGLFLETKQYFIILCYRIADVLGFKNKYYKLSSNYVWKENNEGLYLLIHGILGHPSTWNNHLSLLEKKHPQAEIRAYYVPKRGNCSLEEASEPFVRLVRDYIKKNPGKPICLLGFSNGSRVAWYVEKELRGDAHIKVSSVAGPFFGSRIINFLEKLHIARFILDKSFIEEVRYESDFAKKIISHIQGSPDSTYEFYASKDDTLVYPWTSSLPSGKSSIRVVSGCFHNGLTQKIKDEQIESAITWMRANAANTRKTWWGKFF